MRVLFLDDQPDRVVRQRARAPGADVVWVRNAFEAVKMARAYVYDVVSLDHDLDPGMGTGMAAAMLLAAYAGASSSAIYVVHSMNPKNGPRMFGVLGRSGKTVQYRPFDLFPGVRG